MNRMVLIAVMFLLFTQTCFAQSSNLLCVQYSSAMGGYVYAEIDLANDTIINHTLLPNYLSNIHSSTTTDTVHSLYYISDGMRLFGVNTITDSLEINMFLPVTGSNSMTCIQYNPCDSCIYGVMVDVISDQASSVIRFNPSDSTLTLLAAIGGAYHAGGEGALDAANGIYFFELGGNNATLIGGYDINVAAVSFLTPVSPMNPSITFRGISYDCVHQRLIGLEIHSSIPEIYLSTVDVLSGALTPLSSSPISNTLYFTPGGSCIDHNNGMYYYTPAQAIINRFDVNGTIIGADTLSFSPIIGIETMTSCACAVMTNVSDQSRAETKLYPNPAATILHVSSKTPGPIIIWNVLGECVFVSTLDEEESTIDVSLLSPGSYIVQYGNAEKPTREKFVKE
jgi:hypothetical protein